jgi:hypothetical protein
MKTSPIVITAFLGVAALRAAATECGVNNSGLTAPFAGQWRGADRDLYDIAPGKLDHTFTVHFVTGDETRHSSTYFVATFDVDRGEADQPMLDCRDMAATERDSIERDMANLADAISVPNSDTDRENRKEIAQFRAYLAHPPYRMMAATYYEDKQWLILLSPARLLDVGYGEGDFSVKVYKRVTVSQPAKNAP